MNKTFKKRSLLWLGFALCSLASALLQTIAVLTAYEASANYFRNGSPLPTLAAVFAILGTVLGTAASFLTSQEELAESPFGTRPIHAPATLGFLAVAIVLPLSTHQTTLGNISAIFSAIAILYSVSFLFIKRNKKNDIIVFLGFAAVLTCILITAYYYFDHAVEMNAPLKVSTQTGLLFALLYYTGELRYLIGTARPRVFLMLASWAISIGSLSALSVPVAFWTGKIDRADYAVGGFLVFCIVLTALARMITLLRPRKTEATDNIDENGEEHS